MPKKSKGKDSCEERCCYQIAAVVTVDTRGQTVLPKDVRDKLGIGAGDKLAIIIHEGDGKPCCLSMIKIGDLSKMISGPLGVIIKKGDVER